ncbi:YciI family protein [Pimelobacter simplex]|uniref:YciI family protein n=1 Tax=Nocardioides simplex TaxID=2045 RepID=UPI003815C195
MTTYVVLLTGDERTWEDASPEERASMYARHDEFSRLLEERGHQVTGGAELAHSRTAKVVRKAVGDGEAITVTDGPYVESVEQVGGFYVVESDDLDDLLEVCGVLASLEDGVEVRATVAHDG